MRKKDGTSAISALASLGRVATATTADAELKRGLLIVALQDAFEYQDKSVAAAALLEFAVHNDDSEDDDDRSNADDGGDQKRGNVV